MVESRPLEKALSHVTLIMGITIITFPIFIALVASSHEADTKILFWDHFYDLDAGGGSTRSAEPVC
jgi:ABC-type glycerol-3-phosphate transport system permease component